LRENSGENRLAKTAQQITNKNNSLRIRIAPNWFKIEFKAFKIKINEIF